MRKLFCLVLCLLTIFSINAQSDTTDTGGLFSGAANSARMLAAKHEYNENNMRGALTMYREILAEEPDNASAMYWTARCHYKLKKYNLAKEYLDKAVALEPAVQSDIDFFYGEIHHRLAELELAMEHFVAYLEKETGKMMIRKAVVFTGDTPMNWQEYYKDIRTYLGSLDEGIWKDYSRYMARKHIQQCIYAHEMMGKPAKVTITNMGVALNSRFDDYTPSISGNGQLIVFTSRRSDTKGGEIDEGGDYKFFEDVFYSEWNDKTGEWSTSRGVEGKINTNTYDAVLSISPSADQMFVYRNNRESAGDIFVSQYSKHEQEWGEPVKLDRPINTSYYEGSCSITADGEQLFFVSERPDGLGQGDIYMSQKKGEKWGQPKNLGPVINTDFDEKFVFIHPNGKTMYFSSNGHPTMGSYDIFKSELVNGEWGVPVNLGYPINTVNEESTFSMTRDNKTLLIAAEYDDSYGERDIYQIDVSQYPLISQGYDQNTFGNVVFTVSDASGKRVKNAKIEVYSETGDQVLVTANTDKLGMVKISLPGDLLYRIKVISKKQLKEEMVDVRLKESGETVIKLDIQL